MEKFEFDLDDKRGKDFEVLGSMSILFSSHDTKIVLWVPGWVDYECQDYARNDVQ